MRGRKPVSGSSAPRVSRWRIGVVFREAERGEEPTENEITSAQWETAMNRCRGGRVRVFPRLEAEGRQPLGSFAGGLRVALRRGLCR